MTSTSYKARQMEILRDVAASPFKANEAVEEAAKQLDELFLEVAGDCQDKEEWCTCLDSIREVISGEES